MFCQADLGCCDIGASRPDARTSATYGQIALAGGSIASWGRTHEAASSVGIKLSRPKLSAIPFDVQRASYAVFAAGDIHLGVCRKGSQDLTR